MVVGESRFFSLEAPEGVVDTAQCDLYRDKVFKKSWIPTKTSTAFKVELQTDDLSIGSYEIRTFITDTVDGFIDVFYDSFVLEK